MTEIAIEPLDRASTVGSALPMEPPEKPVEARKPKATRWQWAMAFFGSRSRTQRPKKTIVYVTHNIDATSSVIVSKKTEPVEDLIDYTGAMAILSKARPIDETDPPLGKSPFGA